MFYEYEQNARVNRNWIKWNFASKSDYSVEEWANIVDPFRVAGVEVSVL